MKLLIVESPNKIKKIQGVLGADWVVKASQGHIRDLPKKGGLGVRFDGGKIFPHYEVNPDRSRIIAELKAAAERCDEIYLGTDMDREGEGIAWHIAEILRIKNPQRVVFTEITPKAVLHAVANPRPMNTDLVNAQQARRVLDRVVGWMVSPTCRSGTGDPNATSAGRVQSVALRIVAEREWEIENFVPSAYVSLTMEAEVPGKKPPFKSRLIAVKQDAVKTVAIPDEEPKKSPVAGMQHVGLGIDGIAEAKRFQGVLQGRPIEVVAYDRHEVTVRPYPPFMTSTVTQAASVQPGMKFRPDATMKYLQALFEAGHITYHRTDSTNLSSDAVQEIRSYIRGHYDAAYCPERPHVYASKSANAQEAHEAIRPTHIDVTHISGSPQEQALYEMIWQRTVACQMSHGKDWKTTILSSVDHIAAFETSASVASFDGWRVLTSKAAEDESEDEISQELPEAKVGGALRHLGWSTSEQKTKPPGRFTLASLIKALERHGLGRPSTYANIMSRILTAGYVVETRGKLFATDTGKKLTIFLKKAYADNFIELNYTAKMEESLDDVANGKVEWQGLIDRVSRDLQVKARQAGLSYDVLAGENRSVAQDDGRIWGKPERLQPCNRCGKPIGFIKSEQWIPVDETGIRHRCAPTAKGSQAPKTTRSKGSSGSSKRR